MADIVSFLAAERLKSFEWTRTDCCATADRWCRLHFGVSPLTQLGRSYRNEAEANEWIMEAGGLRAIVEKVLPASGFVETVQPVAGSLGIIRCRRTIVAMAIYTGRFWFSRDANGFLGARAADIAWNYDSCRRSD